MNKGNMIMLQNFIDNFHEREDGVDIKSFYEDLDLKEREAIQKEIYNFSTDYIAETRKVLQKYFHFYLCDDFIRQIASEDIEIAVDIFGNSISDTYVRPHLFNVALNKVNVFEGDNFKNEINHSLELYGYGFKILKMK